MGGEGGDAMQVEPPGNLLDPASVVEVPPDLLTSLGIGFQVAVQGLRSVEPVRMRERLLQMLPQMFKLQELAGERPCLSLEAVSVRSELGGQDQTPAPEDLSTFFPLPH